MLERINTPEERDKRAELMVRLLNLAEHIGPLHGKKVEEVFGNEENRRELIENLSDKEFFELINGINGVLRDKEKEEWKIDGEKVMLTGFVGEHIPPRQEDKAELLRKTFEEAKEMNRAGRSLEDIALLLAASINGVHPYADANGRTSRLIYTLLIKGYKKEEMKDELKNILGEYGREIVDVDPSLLVRELKNILVDEMGLDDPEKNPHRIANVFYPGKLDKSWFREGAQDELIEEFFSALRHDSKFMNLTMYNHVREHPDIERYIKAFPTHSSIMLEQLAPNLGEEELQKIMESYWQLKKRYSELLIDSIAHPEKSEYAVHQEGEESKPLLELFKAGIRQRQQESSSS